jgi:hypothetical protein
MQIQYDGQAGQGFSPFKIDLWHETVDHSSYHIFVERAKGMRRDAPKLAQSEAGVGKESYSSVPIDVLPGVL